MDAASAVSEISKFQNVFKTLVKLMLIDYLFPKQAILKNGDQYDFLIGGGGTAGCVLANRLAAANYTVLVLEAGDIPPYEAFLPGALLYLMNTRFDWNYTAVEDKFTGKCHQNSSPKIPIGKLLGGGSAVNFMVASRGIVNDYQKWAHAANDSSWEFRSLLPYFKKSERLQAPNIANSPVGKCRGVGGTPPDDGEGGDGNIGIAQDNSTELIKYLEAFAEMGNEIVKDLSGRHSVGYARALYSIAEGYRQSTAYGYLVPAYKKYPNNLFVSRNTTVTKIVFDKNKNAIGVEASINNAKPIFLRATKEVIVSAGAIKSPQLLMLSGIGPKKHLRVKNIKVIADLPVGENLQDQFVVTVIHKTRTVSFNGPSELQSYPAYTVVGYKSLESCAGIPDYTTISFIANGAATLLWFCSFPFNFKYEICDRAYQNGLGRQIIYTQILNPYPKSRGKVKLNTTNPYEAPIVDVGYLSNKEDLENMVQYMKDYLPIVNTTFFKEVNASRIDPSNCDVFEPNSDDYLKCYVYCMSSTMWNYGGTCPMGTVVDSRLRVFGVKRLRVVDASIMPNTVTGGNYVPTIVIAEKASDMIKQDNKN